MRDGKLNMSNEQPIEDPMPNETQTQTRDQVIAWLRQNNYSLSSYDRLIASVPGVATYTQLNELVAAFPGVFAPAKIKGGLPGLKLVNPTAPLPQEEPAFNADDLYMTPVHDGDQIVGFTQPVVGVPTDPIVVVPVTEVPVRVPLTPVEAIKALLDKAATTDNSSAAENFATAAKEGAAAIAILKQQASLEI